jgi:hypothetical protein
MGYKNYNANPYGKNALDCTVRAISLALGYDWERTYIELCVQGFIMKNMPTANHVWSAYLKNKGFKRRVIPNECPECYTVRDFCRDHPHGVFILALESHVVTVIDGDYVDTWDSGGKVPIYYWYKEER